MMLGLGLNLGLSPSPLRQATDEDDVPRKYLFIDGGFFKEFIDEMKDVARPEYGDLEIGLSSVGSGFDRVLFYDAYPEKRDNQTDEEFESEVARTENYFKLLSMTRNFSVRPALTSRGQKRQQKGVDILLATDCLMHAIRNNIDEAAIMTSDLDFFPLFEALLLTRTKSILRYQIGKTSSDLIQAADFAEPLTFADFSLWVVSDGRLATGSRSISREDHASAREVASGKIADASFRLMKIYDGYFSLIDGLPIGGLTNSRLFIEGQAEKRMRAKIRYDPAVAE